MSYHLKGEQADAHQTWFSDSLVRLYFRIDGFCAVFSLIAEGFFDEWENKRRDLALTVVKELQMRWDEERESELGERGLRQLNSAKERGLIKYSARPEDGGGRSY